MKRFINKVPFSKYIGIQQENDTLKLEPNLSVENHIGTIHASAQFTLAETQSGLLLERLFPEYKNQVVPLLRSSTVKYKNPATKTVKAYASVDEEAREKFKEQFLKRGRATITVTIEVRDSDDVITMVGEFGWFVQRVEL
ncbi:MAG: DUF4442 domain-containing protein [Epsilonproteobacteria bacterium]|nr:DUF4442 domain-containing protein [Campylobacterota bacterium]